MENRGTEKPPLPPSNYSPGDGIRSMKSTTLFRTVNFELYVKPNLVIMTIGLICFGTTLGYIAYMRSKYESNGYYAAMQQDGTEIYTKKRSKWE